MPLEGFLSTEIERCAQRDGFPHADDDLFTVSFAACYSSFARQGEELFSCPFCPSLGWLDRPPEGS